MHDGVELQQLQPERALLRLGERGHRGAHRRPLDAGAAEDAADAGVCVLQVRRGVAVEGEHAGPVEDVVLDAVAAELGVLQGADADVVTQHCLLGRRQLGTALGHRSPAAVDGLVDELDERDRIAAATLQHLAIVAQHVAEVDVHGSCRRHQPTGHLGHLPHHREVLRLWGADDVDEQCRVQPLDTIDDARKVARGVVEPTAASLHDERQRLALTVGVAGHPHHLGALALGEQARSVKPLEHGRHRRLVHRLAGEVVVGEQHAQLPVRLVEVLRALVHQREPQVGGLEVVARLQLHDAVAGASLELVALVELGAGFPVEHVEVGDLQVVDTVDPRDIDTRDIDEVLDEHAERCAPVADVVLADDLVTHELEQAHQAVADDRGAQVAGVHLLGHVGRRVVDHRALG